MRENVRDRERLEHIIDCLPLIEKYQLFAPLRDKAVFDRFDLDG